MISQTSETTYLGFGAHALLSRSRALVLCYGTAHACPPDEKEFRHTTRLHAPVGVEVHVRLLSRVSFFFMLALFIFKTGATVKPVGKDSPSPPSLPSILPPSKHKKYDCRVKTHTPAAFI